MYQPSKDILASVTRRCFTKVMGIKMTPATDPRYPDAETQKIAEDMEAQGHKLPFIPENPGAIQPPQEEEPADDDKAKAEAEAKAKEEADAKAKEEADAKAKADLEADDKKPDGQPKGDPKETLIVAQKRKIKELETALESETTKLKQDIEKLTTQITSGSPKAPDTKAKVDESADKLETLVDTIVKANEGVDPVLVKSILEAAKQLTASGASLSPELAEKLEKFEAKEKEMTEQKEEQEILATETQRFNDEFAAEIAGNEDIKKIVADSGFSLDEVKAKIHDFVYSKAGVRYTGVPLSELFTLKRDTFVPKKAKSAEAGRGGSSQGESLDGDKPKSAAEIAAMSTADFEKYSNEMAAKSKSRVMRNGKPVT